MFENNTESDLTFKRTMVINKKIRQEQVAARFKHLVVNTYLTDENQIVLDRHISLHAVHTADHPTQAMAVFARLSSPGLALYFSIHLFFIKVWFSCIRVYSCGQL